MIEISYQLYDVPQTNTKINRDVAEKTRKSHNVAYVPTWNDGKTPRHRCRSETEALPSMEPVAQEQSLESRTGRTGWQRFTGKMIFKRFFGWKSDLGTCEKNISNIEDIRWYQQFWGVKSCTNSIPCRENDWDTTSLNQCMIEAPFHGIDGNKTWKLQQYTE